MRGNITRRGKSSWRLKFDMGADSNGKRQTRYVTVRGKRQDAERELTRLLGSADAGTLVEPSKVTIAEYLRTWLGDSGTTSETDNDSVPGLSPKTVERYRELAELQIIPHLGAIPLQKLRPARVQSWHETLIKSGAKGGRPLSARTVGHAHRLLHRALQRAVEAEVLARNVASAVAPPKVEDDEIDILDPDHVRVVLSKLQGHALCSIVSLALASGMRRGELLGLQWTDLDLDGAALRVERSLEETKAGVRFKAPKSKAGRRTISLPPNMVGVLREHRRKQLEMRMALGLGRPDPDALVFCNADGSAISPAHLTVAWRWACVSLGLPRVSFHALRHTHASALIAASIDVVQISKRLGHASPVVTLRIYAHLFDRSGAAAASAIEAVMRTTGER